MKKYFDFHTFVLDCETSGLDPNHHALLSIGGVLLSPELEEMGSLEILLKYPSLEVEMDALEVNKIDLITHYKNPNAMSKESAAFVIKDFFNKFPRPIVLAGWNVSFDLEWFYLNFHSVLEFGTHYLLPYGWPFLSRKGGGVKGTRTIDIQSLAIAIEGVAKPALSNTLEHTALSDARAEANRLREIMQLLKGAE